MFKGTKNYHNVYRNLTEAKSSTMLATTTGTSWNGSSWVQKDQGYQNYGHRSSYQQQHQQQQQQRNYNPQRPRPLPSTDLPKVPPHITPILDPNTAPTSDLVTYYSTIYQHYAQRLQELSSTGSNGDKGSDYQWAEYYADLSTRAAHHYNDLLQQEQKEEQGQGQGPSESQGQAQQNYSHSPGPGGANGNGGGGAPPPSFQEYAHRNLSRCGNDTQKSAMTELIQMTIKRAVQDGSMFHKRWETEPLLPLPGPAAAYHSTSFSSSSSSSQQYQSQNQSSPSYTSSSKGKSKSQPQYQSQYSYLDAAKGKNRSASVETGSSSGKRKSDLGPLAGPNSTPPYKKKKSSSYGNDNAYDDLLPQNDSYYGAPNRSTSVGSDGGDGGGRGSGRNFSSNGATNYNDYDEYKNNNNNNNVNGGRRSSQKDYYDDALPTNDSYYGRGSSVNTNNSYGSGGGGSADGRSPSSHNSRSRSKTTAAVTSAKNGRNGDYYGATKARASPSPTSLSASSSKDFQFGDYVSLSSLSTDKYVKKKNKLVKATSLDANANGALSSSLSLKKKKTNALKGAKLKSSKSKLASRLSRFSGEGGIQDASSLALHNGRGGASDVDKYMGKTVIGGGMNSKKKLDEDDYENMTVRGSCQVLDKEYLRLTAPPKAELVRPQRVLEKHLKNLQKQWEGYRSLLALGESGNGSNSGGGGKVKGNKRSSKSSKQRDYNWFCSQLKAIRQDLTVQRIFNAFAVEVYETHARIALEEGDLNEYNQSQTKLKELYEILSHNNDDESLAKGLKNQNEFIAYRIIYYIFLTGNKKYDGGSSDLFKIMLSLSPEQRLDPCIAHALKVRVAVADNDYHAFFRLQDTCPNIGAYLMDTMIGQIRATGLQCMMKAYRPSLSVKFILNELGFNINGELDADGGLLWLKNCGCKLNGDESMVLTKDTMLNESNLLGKKNSSLI
eukprot:CAMPEP_0203666378 /NCGR_PEP_ID=MMETSP0090-20130426/3427_1 /ASSEMBLY_ACC=CAM_ASM_001088 /TAXON_ID=426623 /ORGANISM="Chaetoceros affinis, Strain CCMP159" /LENGTH=946 /DNA_ID=CAMNT_0050530239 /DNA_START=153 /DNA_END=2993 /DNA_ORIENTATION=+